MNDEFNESESFLGGKGFYIALMLCVSIIVVSAWMLVNNSREEEADVLAEISATPYVHREVIEWEEPEIVITPAPVIEEDVPNVMEVIVPESVQEPEQEVYVPVEEGTVPVVNLDKLSYVWPVIGEVELPYSMDRLTFNVTMNDWRTHDGIDIAAQAGTYVRAAAAGTVTDVYDDVMYGTTVVIDHGAGLVSYYANLQADPVVRTGDSVLAGDTIGAVGTTAICETGEPPHLHFAMSLNDESVDPGTYMPVL